MHIRVFWSVQALYGATNALYWKCFKRQNSTHLTPVKHQNTKTSLYKLTKNYWVITLFEILGSVRRDLQSTVSLDHPVTRISTTSQHPIHLLLRHEDTRIWMLRDFLEKDILIFAAPCFVVHFCQILPKWCKSSIKSFQFNMAEDNLLCIPIKPWIDDKDESLKFHNTHIGFPSTPTWSQFEIVFLLTSP